MCSWIDIFWWKFFLERFGSFLTQKIDFESLNLAIFDNFYSTDHKTFLKTSIFKPLYFLKWRPIFDDFYSTHRKTKKLFKGQVVGFGPKGKPDRICNSVR